MRGDDDERKFERGRVVYYNDETKHGYVQPQWSNGDRKASVWFGPKSIRCALKKGDEVEFSYNEKNAPGKQSRAYAVRLFEKETAQ